MAGLRLLPGQVYRLAAGSQIKTVKKVLFESNIARTASLIRRYSVYEEEGKTVAFVTNKKSSEMLCIDRVRTDGFILADGNELLGSIVIFPHSVLSWNISHVKEINEDSLILFKILEPKVDILIIGYGSVQDYSPEHRVRLIQLCKNLGVRFELLPTDKACGIYNFLASELRYVAGAFVPPSQIAKLKFTKPKAVSIEEEEEDEEEEEEDQKLVEPKSTEKDKKLIKE